MPATSRHHSPGRLALLSRRNNRGHRAEQIARTEPLERRMFLTHVPGHHPVIELKFDEPLGSETVADSAPAGGSLTGDFAGDVLPELQNTDPSPAGGNFVH